MKDDLPPIPKECTNHAMTQAQLICRNLFLKCSLNTKKDFQIAKTISILSDNVAQYYADNVEAIQEKRTEVNTLMRLAI